jgi:ferritin-like metal-binding protein YciE
MEKNASDSELKKGFAEHLKQTENHIVRLEDCFAELGKKPQAEKCDAMAGLLEEADGLIKDSEPGAVRDAALIAAAQKVEHYEIATYGTLAAFAKVLEHKKGLKLLVKTLEEEKKCDEELSKLADTNLNTKAISA